MLNLLKNEINGLIFQILKIEVIKFDHGILQKLCQSCLKRNQKFFLALLLLHFASFGFHFLMNFFSLYFTFVSSSSLAIQNDYLYQPLLNYHYYQYFYLIKLLWSFSFHSQIGIYISLTVSHNPNKNEGCTQDKSMNLLNIY